jgi:hypothetical protein
MSGGRIRSLHSTSFAPVLPYLLHDLLILSRVVLEGLVGRRGDDPLALLELLGLRLGRHFELCIELVLSVWCVFVRRGRTDVFVLVG